MNLAAIRSANAKYLSSLPPTSLPVAVFVGGTSGIGRGMAENFARHTNGNAHIVLVGRNKAAAESIISNFPRPSSLAAKHEFIQCDVTLMKNIQKATEELSKGKINYLVMSPGYITVKDRDESEEGIDRKLAVHYYARWKFINDLLPALKKAKEMGEDAKVFSVLGAGQGGSINVNDLGMRQVYSKMAVKKAGPTYNDLMMEEFSSRNPGITFIHAWPGWVRTPIGSQHADSAVVRGVSTMLNGILRPLMMSAETSGECMLYGMLNTANEPRAWRLTEHGEDIGMKNYFGTEEERTALWVHTVEEMRNALVQRRV
ncbi:hypothetical protein Moror_14125 [Moniliophthora roreri MCA 2997]|uniref:NAD(P)-binding protein n=2 Tax=Moniliophthora roreri TaxID=221103 RepID=V2XM82_MONRO|nr:hypothetical protein Moror_14125 [Moniliophthora roreri MCA 2997]KAI3619922.1 hypothetical protein WG66_002792 [Moniliophthora roreri]